MPDVEGLKSQMATLSATQRAELALFLIRSLDAVEDADTEQAWQTELDRRCEEIRAGTVQGIPAEAVFAELRRKLS